MSDADWLEWRRGGIGASDVARAATGKYGGGPIAVVSQKLGLLPEAGMIRGRAFKQESTTGSGRPLGPPRSSRRRRVDRWVIRGPDRRVVAASG